MASSQSHQHTPANPCAAACQNGWLQDYASLRPLWPADEQLPDLHDFRPLCPLCFGRFTVSLQLRLRARAHSYETTQTSEEVDRYNLDIDRLQSSVAERYEELGLGRCCSCIDCLLPNPFWPHPANHEQAVYQTALLDNGIAADETTFPNASAPVSRPATEAAIEALPRKRYGEHSGEPEQCTVCLQDLVEDSEVAVLPCQHVLCEDGCTDWLRHQRTCPVCRSPLPQGDAVPTHAAAPEEVPGDGWDDLAWTTTEAEAWGATGDEDGTLDPEGCTGEEADEDEEGWVDGEAILGMCRPRNGSMCCRDYEDDEDELPGLFRDALIL